MAAFPFCTGDILQRKARRKVQGRCVSTKGHSCKAGRTVIDCTAKSKPRYTLHADRKSSGTPERMGRRRFGRVSGILYHARKISGKVNCTADRDHEQNDTWLGNNVRKASTGLATGFVALMAAIIKSFAARLLTNHPVMKYRFMASLGTAVSAFKYMGAWFIAGQDVLKLVRLGNGLRELGVPRTMGRKRSSESAPGFKVGYNSRPHIDSPQ
ncbi:MAG: hypothetical protein Q9192_001476 [Flavoplaca navasiana]